MITSKIKIATLALVLMVLFPNASNAYFTTNQEAVWLSDNQALFTISYQFGFLNRELFMPIGAERSVGPADKTPYIGYELLLNGEKTNLGKTAGLVLSTDEDVVYQSAEYYTPEGRSAIYTLYVIADFSDTTLPSDAKLSLSLTHLPFTMITREKETVSAYLNPTELIKYRTPDITTSNLPGSNIQNIQISTEMK
jgi:hypothetical protein